MRLEKNDLPRAFRSSKAFIMAGAVNEEAIEKVCECGHYDAPDKFGFCQDDDCRRDRFIRALFDGKAKKLSSGEIVWCVE